MNATPFVEVYPTKALVDVPLKICARGLKAKQEVTLRSKLISDSRIPFYCVAHYVTRYDGTLDLNRDASVGGYFKGVEPMGLITSMRVSPDCKRKYTRLGKTDVTTPYIVEFAVFDTHIESIEGTLDLEALAATKIERWYKNQNVSRVSIASNDVEGTLFIPQNGQQFPGVIDLFGIKPGITEYRSALLASRGYVTLALKYFKMDLNKPETLKIEMDYFERAITFLSNHEKVRRGGIGVVGNSLGGTIALFMASYFDDIRCIVSINGPIFPFPGDFIHRGRTWKQKEFDLTKIQIVDNAYQTRDARPEMSVANLGDSMIEFHKSEADILFLISEDDHSIRGKEMVTVIRELMEIGNKANYEICANPGAGHLLEPPYSPFIGATYTTKDAGEIWGGNAKDHAKAQEKSWKKMLNFLQKKLYERPSETGKVLRPKL